MSELNSIQQFYAGKTIFITGASGFMGKVLMEKLLYSCSDVKEIIILMRDKEGKSGQQRVKEFSQLPMFERIMNEKPEVMKKIFPVIGDISRPDFDLSADHHKRVTDRTQIVFHLAASPKFEATLKPNVVMNLIGTKNALDLAKQMKKLIQMVHLSTAFCNIEQEIVDEKVYDFHHKPADLIKRAKTMGEEAMAMAQKEILGVHPNTYTYTKRLAEILVRDEYENLPVCIVRPSIVTPAVLEPLPGWVDTLNGPVGVVYAAAKGVLRSMLVDPNGLFEMVPVDIAVSGLIVIAKELSTAATKPMEIPVFHLSLHKSRQITYQQLHDLCKTVGIKYPFSGALWYPDSGITQNWLLHNYKVYFFQLLPAYVIDFLLMIFRQKPFLIDIQKQIKVGCELIKFFSNRKWNFKSDNFEALIKKQSKAEYKMFSIDTVIQRNDDEYIKNCILGARQYCVKDPLSTLPLARVQYKFQYILHLICYHIFLFFAIRSPLRKLGLYQPLEDMTKAFFNAVRF